MKKLASSFAIATIVTISLFIPIRGATAAECKVTQELTEGPYYSTDTPLRSNIISSQIGKTTKLTLKLVDSNCRALQGVKVDIWHANAMGEYSSVRGNSENYLRGSQLTNSAGKVTFITKYPGWYPGRTMHIHFKVWRNGEQVLTSQFFAPEAKNTKIYTTGAYAARGDQNTSLNQDRIYLELGDPKSLTLKVKISKKITATGLIVIP